MRILLLTQWFDPEPTFKGLVFAKKLHALGHEVEVLTGFPNYPGGKIYPGYSIKPIQVELMEGIRVMRVPLYPSHDRSAVRRIMNYASFALSSCLAGLFAIRRPNVIHTCGPPVTVGISACLISLFRRAPFVYDIQDLWPDTLGATGMLKNPKALKVVDWVCDWMYKRAAHIAVPALGIRDRLLARGVPENKLSVIYSWCDESSIDGHSLKLKTGLPSNVIHPKRVDHAETPSETFDVLFAGTMGKVQALDAVLGAALILKRENPAVRFLLLGGGIEVDRLKTIVEDQLLTNVKFLPRVPMSEVGAILARADALLVHLKDDPLFRITIPSKTQAYLVAGKPIIMAVAGDAAQLIRASEAGVCAQPEDARSIADAINHLTTLEREELLQMGQRGQRYYREQFSLDSGARKFLHAYESTLNKRRIINNGT